MRRETRDGEGAPDMTAGDLQANGGALPAQVGGGGGGGKRRPKSLKAQIEALSRAAAAGQGAMVALPVPPDVASQIAVPGGIAPSALHLTLAYVDRPDMAALGAAVRGFASVRPALSGLLSGVGRFLADNPESQDVLHATVDVPGLAEMRTDLVRTLADAGIAVNTVHGFDPHVTLAYLPPGEQADIFRTPVPVRFAEILVASGTEGERFPLAPEADGVVAKSRDNGAPRPVDTSANAQRSAPEAAMDPLLLQERAVALRGCEEVAAQRRERVFRWTARVVRVDAAKKQVFGEVYVPFDPQDGSVYQIETINDVVDTWGTFMRPGTLEALAHAYLKFCRNVDKMHDRETTAGLPIESYVAREGDPRFAPGAWVFGVQVSDAVWPDVASGKITGFSIDVLAARRPTAVRVSGFGRTIDLTGVTEHPYVPRVVQVAGPTTLRLDELVNVTPNFVSLVDRASNRRKFSELRDGPPEFRRDLAVAWIEGDGEEQRAGGSATQGPLNNPPPPSSTAQATMPAAPSSDGAAVGVSPAAQRGLADPEVPMVAGATRPEPEFRPARSGQAEPIETADGPGDNDTIPPPEPVDTSSASARNVEPMPPAEAQSIPPGTPAGQMPPPPASGDDAPITRGAFRRSFLEPLMRALGMGSAAEAPPQAPDVAAPIVADVDIVPSGAPTVPDIAAPRIDEARAEEEHLGKQAMEAFQRGAVPYQETPEGSNGKWDGDAARGRLKTWAGINGPISDATPAQRKKYAEGFGYVGGDGTQEGDFKLPHHDVVGGKLVLDRAGLLAAGAAVMGARGGTDIPGGDLAAVKAHLGQHYKALGLTAPWDREARRVLRALIPFPIGGGQDDDEDDDGPLDFDEEFSGDADDRLNDAIDTLSDVLGSIVSNIGEYADPQAVVDAMADQVKKFLQSSAHVLAESNAVDDEAQRRDAMRAVCRAPEESMRVPMRRAGALYSALRALAYSTPGAPGIEARRGMKHSAETAAKMKDAFGHLHAAAANLAGMIKEHQMATNGQQVAPAGASAAAAQTAAQTGSEQRADGYATGNTATPPDAATGQRAEGKGPDGNAAAAPGDAIAGAASPGTGPSGNTSTPPGVATAPNLSGNGLGTPPMGNQGGGIGQTTNDAGPGATGALPGNQAAPIGDAAYARAMAEIREMVGGSMKEVREGMAALAQRMDAFEKRTPATAANPSSDTPEAATANLGTASAQAASVNADRPAAAPAVESHARSAPPMDGEAIAAIVRAALAPVIESVNAQGEKIEQVAQRVTRSEQRRSGSLSDVDITPPSTEQRGASGGRREITKDNFGEGVFDSVFRQAGAPTSSRRSG